ncbi:MAG: hypothetical protein KC433_07115 [Anaerolineales bacterium]|nr:hypothetical protein [Anaerolineales bacterium]MCB8937024.1 hypothetical protein [Ardenticatenaceae bacterium]
MLLKRLGIGVVSLLVGFGLAVIIIQLIGTTLEEFGVYYTFFLSLSLGCAIAIWLDKFLGTEMLPK